MSWDLEERPKHVAQWGKAIFFIICRKTDDITHINHVEIQKKYPHNEAEGAAYLFFSQAVEGQLFLYSVACVDHQVRVCWAEGSQAGRWAVILQHKLFIDI